MTIFEEKKARKTIILTESQYNFIIEQRDLLIESGILESTNIQDFISKAKKLLKRGVTITAILGAMSSCNFTPNEETQIKQALNNTNLNLLKNEPIELYKNDSKPSLTEPISNKWELISDTTTATVYNPTVGQCNNDVAHTANMFRLNLNNVNGQRVLAMERTMMKKNNIHYGDVVYVDDVGDLSGVYRVVDTMNKRFAGMDKVDILQQKRKYGKWDNAKVYKLRNSNDNEDYISLMEPSFKQI